MSFTTSLRPEAIVAVARLYAHRGGAVKATTYFGVG